ncbi:sugar ABC transporter substrate-binding protein [Nisaea acidiphila]|uniref:Sugar ABC transporter substrate-binding protein n=1 Tax=Nisaea acidiphila TaxID=1862145 RepID=A0A9J7ART0_9PROT|nr:sugar ABC transporter substrate-binding protein [Nisaea acidiphila]UUX49959.1 sugar ABC transporter substrate-binding protein [Nisaea acidiphila]
MATGYRICCLTKNKSNPAYVGAQIAAGRLAENLGCALTGASPDTPDDLEEQREILVRAIDSRPDAILIAPVHTSALDPELQKAKDAGIPLFYFVAHSALVTPECFVTSNNYDLALEAARHLFENLGGHGRIGLIEGSPQSPTSAPRTKGFCDAAAEYPGISIALREVGHYQRSGGKEAMKRILERDRQLDGLLAANDAMALGALDELGETEASMPVVGMNAMPEAIEAIRLGRMLATVSFDAPALVCTALMAAVRLLDGEAIPERIELPAEVIGRENCAAWDCAYEERPLPSWNAALR